MVGERNAKGWVGEPSEVVVVERERARERERERARERERERERTCFRNVPLALT